jgi:hypothetical protein
MVKAPLGFLLPEKVQTMLPSFKTVIEEGCPSVLGGFDNFTHVEDAPDDKLLVIYIPPC